jgi:hypothetical protein
MLFDSSQASTGVISPSRVSLVDSSNSFSTSNDGADQLYDVSMCSRFDSAEMGAGQRDIIGDWIMRTWPLVSPSGKLCVR